MKILLLSDINSAHTQKWVLSLKQYDITIGIFSLTSPDENKPWNTSNIELFYLPESKSRLNPNTSFSKIKYLKVVPYLRKVIHQFSPDIVHAHYISSYGLLAILSNFHPLVLSAWGSDVMEFPNKSIIHKKVLQFILKKTDIICVTSKVLNEKIVRFTSKKPVIIPFGIDCNFFKPIKIKNDDIFIIGTTKSLEKIYGIDIVIRAFSALYEKYPNKKLKLTIIGDGSQFLSLKNLTIEHRINHITHFLGHHSVNEMPTLINEMDVLVNVSRNESFGVSVLEASACEKCVVATNVGGLTEVVDNKKTGFLIKPDNPEELTAILEYLMLNPAICDTMGKRGREKVINEFDLNKAVQKYLKIYKNLI